MQNIRRDLKMMIVGVVFILAVWHLLKDLDTVPFHPDESGWVTSGYSYSRLVLTGDFSLKHWMKPTRFDYHDTLNPSVGKYFIGFAMWFALPHQDYFYKYDWSQSLQQNSILGNIPSIEVLRPGRLIAAIIACFSCLILFLFCRKVWNWIVSCVAVLMLAFNPVFTLAVKRVMVESFMIFFLLLAQLCCLGIIRHAANKKKLLLFSAFAGAAAGLCASVKISGLCLLIQYFVILLFLWLVLPDRKKQFLNCMLALLTIGVTFAAVTILVNPILYNWSPKVIFLRYLYIVTERTMVFANQLKMFPEYAIHGFPWILFRRILYDYFPLPLSACLIAGIVVCIRRLQPEIRSQIVTNQLVPLVFFFGNLLFISALIPLDWDRYYLPILCANVPLAAFGLWWVTEKCARLVAARMTPVRKVAS